MRGWGALRKRVALLCHPISPTLRLVFHRSLAIAPFSDLKHPCVRSTFADNELHLTSRIVAMSFCEPRSCIGRLSS